MRVQLPDLLGLVVVVSLFLFTWGALASDVHPDAASARPLQPGSSVPSARITQIDGTQVDLSQLTRESGALLVFYRGGW